MTNIHNVLITDPTTPSQQAVVNDVGYLNSVNHQHPEGGHIYFQDIISATTDYILIDLSDTTNYPHDFTGSIHISNFSLLIDADNTADYLIQVGYLSNVDATNGDFNEIHRVSGTKKTGTVKEIYYSVNPEAPRLISSRITTSNVSANDTAFQTDVNLASTLDPATADTPSGNGDLVLRVTINAGSIDISSLLGYHSHS